MRVKSDDTLLWWNVVIILLCLTYLYYKLDKEIAHVYQYAKTLDCELVKVMSDIEVRDAAVSKVQDASA